MQLKESRMDKPAETVTSMTEAQKTKAILENLNSIKALSIRQPWCHRILHEGKDVENRSWPTKNRGWFLIHAAQSEQVDRKLIREKQLPLGGIVGAMLITDCVTEMNSSWFYGKFGFVISERIEIPFIPLKGLLGFFNPGDEVRDKVRAKLKSA